MKANRIALAAYEIERSLTPSQKLARHGHPGYSDQFAHAVLLHMEREHVTAHTAIDACYSERRHNAIVTHAMRQTAQIV